jgi:hypothetical protein
MPNVLLNYVRCRILKKLLNLLSVILGLILIPWAIYSWSKTGFLFEDKLHAGTSSGRFFLIIIAIGLLLLFNGLWSYFVLRHKDDVVILDSKNKN